MGTTDNFDSAAATRAVATMTQPVAAPTITPPTTFTADVGPIAYVY